MKQTHTHSDEGWVEQIKTGKRHQTASNTKAPHLGILCV